MGRLFLSEQVVWRLIVRTILFALLVAALAWFAWTVRSILILLIVAIILATGLIPVLDAITGTNPPRSRLRLPRPAALLIVYLGLFLILDLIIAGIIPPLVGEVNELATNAPRYLESARQSINSLAQTYPFLEGLDQRITTALEQSATGFGNVFGQASSLLGVALRVVDVLITFVLLLVLTFYLIVDGRSLRDGVLRLIPAENRPLMRDVFDHAKVKLGGWLVGQAALSAIIGTTTFVGLTILGVPYAILLAVIAAIGELIPMVGPWLSAVPAVAVALVVSPWLALLTALLYLLIQQLENNLIVPMVMRRAVDLSPVIVMSALLMGGEMLGVIGAILALPVAATLSVFVSELLALRDGQETSAGHEVPPAS